MESIVNGCIIEDHVRYGSKVTMNGMYIYNYCKRNHISKQINNREFEDHEFIKNLYRVCQPK